MNDVCMVTAVCTTPLHDPCGTGAIKEMVHMVNMDDAMIPQFPHGRAHLVDCWTTGLSTTGLSKRTAALFHVVLQYHIVLQYLTSRGDCFD